MVKKSYKKKLLKKKSKNSDKKSLDIDISKMAKDGKNFKRKMIKKKTCKKRWLRRKVKVLIKNASERIRKW